MSSEKETKSESTQKPALSTDAEVIKEKIKFWTAPTVSVDPLISDDPLDITKFSEEWPATSHAWRRKVLTYTGST